VTRTTIPTGKNVRHLKAKPTTDELHLYLITQQRIHNALIKTSETIGIIEDAQFHLRTDPAGYPQPVVQFTLAKQGDDEYAPYLKVTVELSKPTRPNPDFNPDLKEEWDY
jgi:hypothetical protein